MATPKGQLKEDFSGLSNYFLKIKFGTVEVPVDAINCLVIREWIFEIVPRLELTLTDNGTFAELWNIQDNTEITIELGKNSGDVEGCEIDNNVTEKFIVDNSTIDVLAGNKSNIITLTAYMKYTDLFHPIHNRSFKKKSSIAVLSQIANEIGWTVNAKTKASSDVMTWLQINQNNYDMIRHVLKRSHISDDILFAYATVGGRIRSKTFPSKFNIISLKTEVQTDVFKIMRFDLNNAMADFFKEKADEQTLWTNGYKYLNLSGYLNKAQYGYGVTSSYYDLIKMRVASSKVDYHPYAKISNQSHIGDYIDSINFGTLTDNVNENYYKGMLTNKNMLGISFGSLLVAKVNPLGDVNLMDSVNFAVPSINDQSTNTLLGGNYIVGGKTWYASKGSPLQLEVAMFRNGRNQSGYNLETDKVN